MLEHAWSIVKVIFQISKIILPNPEILCFYIMFYRALEAESWAAGIFFFFWSWCVGISHLQAKEAVAMQRDGSCPYDPGGSTVIISAVW